MTKDTKFSDMLKGDKTVRAIKALDYLDGCLEKHLIRQLNTAGSGRKDWKSRGIQPRTRNITKMVVEKSGLLFSDKAPILAVYDDMESKVVNPTATATLTHELDKIDWVEFFSNFDSTVRLLKTALILVQYDAETDLLVLDTLTRANCAVVLNQNKTINTLIYQTSEIDPEDKEEVQTFRVFTKDIIQDITVDKNGKETISNAIPNPFGIIPVAAFHDTQIPRAEFWNHIPNDLLQINDMYNLHITDSEYAASWSKLQTLFTNCRIQTSEDMQMEQVVPYGSVLPRMAPSAGSLIGGPSSVIQIDTTGVDSPFVEYKGPNVDLQPIDDMFNKWVSDFAADWSVNVKTSDGNAAESGFKLIVEELPNLELRKRRAKMMEAGFSRLYKVIAIVLNSYNPGMLPTDSILDVIFFDPILPTDTKEQELTWTMRITEGRATRVDYFMATQGLTKEEAITKVAEIDAERTTSPAPVNPPKTFVAKL